MKRTKGLTDNTVTSDTSPAADHPAFPQALLDHVMANYKQPSDLIGENGTLKQLTKAVFEAALNAEMNQRLGHARHGSIGNASGNVRNGHSAKTISGDFGEVEITIPRDRDASFTPATLAQATTPRLRLRRAHPVALCTWHEHPRDRRPLAGNVGDRGITDADLDDHRHRGR
jgi:hypothetical protein